MTRIVVTGTDTGIGKTVFSAALAGALSAHYWKPIQAGLDEGADRDTVAALSGAEPARILPEAYRLTTPCSPHRAAEIDGILIDPARLAVPDVAPLVIEGAGGALVPVGVTAQDESGRLLGYDARRGRATRALDVLEFLARRTSPAPAAIIASQCAIPRSSLYALRCLSTKRQRSCCRCSAHWTAPPPTLQAPRRR